MKYNIILLVFIFNINLAHAFDVFVANQRFYAPKIGSYIETEILIPAKGLKFIQNENKNYQAQVEITLLYKKNGSIITYDKYLLNSIEIADSNSKNISLIDKKRFTLEPGTYTVEGYFKDINSNEEKNYQETIILDFNQQQVFISDIAFIDSYNPSEENNIYTKNGFQQIPYVLNYFPENINSLIFYSEIYNTQKAISATEMLTVKYAVQKYKTDEVIKELSRSNKVSAKEVNVLFSEFDIKNLPSGNYEIIVEVRKPNDELLAVKKTFFQRSKEITNYNATEIQNIDVANSFLSDFTFEEMQYQFRALTAIASNNEKQTMDLLVKQNKLELMKQFYLNYWQTINSANPKAEWEKYMVKIAEVNQQFSSCFGKGYGFETDRGRVYLQYGKPNQNLARTYEAGTYPYEIWHYYTTETGKQNNVRFVFVDKTISCNNYLLIHSNALGEIYNNQWATLIKKANNGNTPDEEYDMNKVRTRDGAGNRINTMFKE